MTPEQLKQKRVAAGARYAKSVDEFHEARINLAALDQLADANGFGNWPSVTDLRHSEFAPDVGGHWQSEVRERCEQISAEAA